MANGKTLEMIAFSRAMGWRHLDRPAHQRDRSLRGKARIKARREVRRGR